MAVYARYEVVNLDNGESMATDDLELLLVAVKSRDDFMEAKNLVWVCEPEYREHMIHRIVNGGVLHER